MAIEELTYVDLGERLNISAEAARALARRMNLPRQTANDGLKSVGSTSRCGGPPGSGG